jgi:CheY-like chemotaxis protein
MTVANEPALRVLLLEDSRVDQELIARSLRDAGLDCDIHVAGSRPDLLRQINDFVPDVVLADYSVPGLDGLAALETVRSGWPDVPFIFVSGTIGEERAIALLQRGATDYVLKSNLAR